ncbi:MAG TPA: type VI secretion system tip protein TssI/VgrG [Polyangiaceae bacterium]|nr:type VI secretion system tip protein TssI/VgrG [Polyangiaceae bacterium]
MALFDVQLACEPLGECIVLALEGREAMHQLSHWQLRIASDADVEPRRLTNAAATIVLLDPDERVLREIALVVVRAQVEPTRGTERIYRLELSDVLWPLTQKAGYRLFQQQTTEQIVKDLVSTAFPSMRIVSRLSSGYVTWPQRVQYGEVEWDFIVRMLADDGIAFWFDTIDDTPTLVLGDALGAFSPIPKVEGDGDVPVIPYIGPHGMRAPSQRSFATLEWEERACHDMARVRDYDIAHPDVPIEGKAGADPGEREYFEWPARVPDATTAGDRALRRLEQLRRDEIVVRGKCDCVRLRPGRKLKIGCDDLPMGGAFDMFDRAELVVASLHHRYTRSARGAEPLPYGAEVELRPCQASDGSDRPPYRPAIVPPVRADQFESAVITGASGEEIHVDEYGRVKLRFPWDRSGIVDDGSSYWARCLQLPVAAPMFLPRVDWEVVVSYLDGVPDHPFVLGRLYNATAVTPYALPARSASTGMVSASSPGGGGAHEIRNSDDAGREEYYVNATRDQSENVGNDARTDVGANEETNVDEAWVSFVGGGHNLSAGSQEIGVGNELILNVDGSNDELIAGGELINVTANRAVHASSYYLEIIAGAYAIQCNQANYNASGLYARGVVGHMGLAAGIGMTESVLAARVYACGGTRNVNVSKSYGQTVYGGLRSNSGPVTEKGAGVGVKAWSGNRTTGVTTITASGKVSITAKNLTLDVDSLVAGTLEIGGGKLSAKGGTTEVKGDAHRMRGGKVGA